MTFASIVLPTVQANPSEPASVYAQKIKPLLMEKCTACHGSIRSESGLRLDAIQFIRKGSDSGLLTRVSENSAKCILVERVSSEAGDMRMPPEGEGAALDAEQVAMLDAWLRAGMPGPDSESFLTGPQDHWAFKPIVRPEVPMIAQDNHRIHNAIDAFVVAKQIERGIVMTERASSVDWLRRVAFDVTGLPPAQSLSRLVQSEISAEDRERIAERLLNSPQYGQRWGRHWMDVWRYSDWDGFKDELRGSQRHIWHWRDWIVESLNDNKPYDAMIVEMLAADEVAPQDTGALRATGFLARNYHISNRDMWLDAAVEHTTKAFLGLTVQCARCHDHKYDPIAQESFYQFRAIFEPHRTRTEQLPVSPM